MSQGPAGLGGGRLRPAPASVALVNVAPISVAASAGISTRVSLVFMVILFAGPEPSRPATCGTASFILDLSRRDATLAYSRNHENAPQCGAAAVADAGGGAGANQCR